MNLSGFTYIKNGSSLHYPFIESIKSLLPIDKFSYLLFKNEYSFRIRFISDFVHRFFFIFSGE
jgi:hypothetical protein